MATKLGGAGNGDVMIFLSPENKERVIKALKEIDVKAFILRIDSRAQ